MHHDLKLCKIKHIEAKLVLVLALIHHALSQSSSLTVNSDLSVSIFVCSFEECFCLIVCEVSSFLGKALENVPVNTSKKRCVYGGVCQSGADLCAHLHLDLT